MNESKRDCSWIDDQLDAYIDGDLAAAERARLEAHSRSCPHCAAALELAMQMQEQLATWPSQPCPPAVTAAVYRQLEKTPPAPWRQRLQHWLGGWQPLAGAAAMVVLLVAALSLLHMQRPAQPDRAELAQMQRQAKWTLVYLSQIGQRTSRTLRDEVLKERLIKPVAKNLTKRL